jgi:aminobenzoyl-glutamate transport protein
MPKMDQMTEDERRGLRWGVVAMLLGIAVLVVVVWPASSAMRGGPGRALTHKDAPLMKSIVPLIFLLFIVPGIVHGFIAKTFTNHRDVVKAMAKSMSGMGCYLVMAFFAALFIYSFNKSQLGACSRSRARARCARPTCPAR